MYARLTLPPIPDPFQQFPTPEEPLTTLQFLDVMTVLLGNCQGLAGTAWVASRTQEAAHQDLSQALYVLNEYLQATVTLFARWKVETSVERTSSEEAADPMTCFYQEDLVGNRHPPVAGTRENKGEPHA
jgi:hypothetical protein